MYCGEKKRANHDKPAYLNVLYYKVTVLKENLLFLTMRRHTEQQTWFAIWLLRGGSAQAYHYENTPIQIY